MKVKVFGAGSIGNHLSHASRSLGWSVDICDVDQSALDRTKNSIYPSRYGAWDEEIGLYLNDDAPKGGYDLICIGTPPDVHVELARAAIAESPKMILVEKPFCRPDLEGAQELLAEAAAAGIKITCGYDHAVGEAADISISECKNIGEIETLDVEFREHWGGIFNAHPWLDGPSDTYLGFWKRGGGASGEHSHAIHLWQTFAHAVNKGRVIEVQAQLDYVSDDKVDYDRLCLMNLTTENGFIGRVVQDVVTKPTRKWARVQGTGGAVEWYGGYQPGQDAVVVNLDGEETKTEVVEKTRPDDFIRELKHLEAVINADADSPIHVTRALETMMVVAAAHRSHAAGGRRVRIDYEKGFVLDALSEI